MSRRVRRGDPVRLAELIPDALAAMAKLPASRQLSALEASTSELVARLTPAERLILGRRLRGGDPVADALAPFDGAPLGRSPGMFPGGAGGDARRAFFSQHFGHLECICVHLGNGHRWLGGRLVCTVCSCTDFHPADGERLAGVPLLQSGGLR